GGRSPVEPALLASPGRRGGHASSSESRRPLDGGASPSAAARGCPGGRDLSLVVIGQAHPRGYALRLGSPALTLGGRRQELHWSSARERGSPDLALLRWPRRRLRRHGARLMARQPPRRPP